MRQHRVAQSLVRVDVYFEKQEQHFGPTFETSNFKFSYDIFEVHMPKNQAFFPRNVPDSLVYTTNITFVAPHRINRMQIYEKVVEHIRERKFVKILKVFNTPLHLELLIEPLRPRSYRPAYRF